MQILKNFLFFLLIVSTSYAEPGVGGGGGGPGMTQPLRFIVEASKETAPVFTIKDAVDVTLADDEVLDIQELQDRFGDEVTKDGDDLKISHKIPVTDFQNHQGEVIRIKRDHRFNGQN